MPKPALRGEVLLFITALIWGTSFVAQRVGMEHVQPFTFTAVRFLIGALFLLVLIFVMDALTRKTQPVRQTGTRADLLRGGVACGLALFAGVSFQQYGIQYTSAGKAGFITALYMLLVPLFGLFLHKSVGRRIWLAVALGLTGLYLLTVTGGFSISAGDLIVLGGTVFWAIHILLIDHFAPKVDGRKMAFLQFFIAAAISAVVAVLTETIQLASILNGAGPILFGGILVVGVAYTLQIFGQKNANPAVAAIILSLESVIAVIAGMLLLGEVMSAREIIGCVLMFAAVIIAEAKPSTRVDQLALDK